MKKWTSLALLGLTSATLLVACGSKKEEIQKQLNLVQKKQHNQVKQPQRLIQQVVTKLQIHLKWFLQSW